MHKNLKSSLKDLSDTERLMKIGIVGRVKAGKSSLLNAIAFNGKNVLPKAATPMTAALTEIGYGEKFAIEVDFLQKKILLILKKILICMKQSLKESHKRKKRV